MIMGIKLSDYINDENKKLTPEEVRQFLIDYGFDEALEKFDEKLESNEDYIEHHIPHFTNMNITDNTEEPMKFIKRIAKEDE